LEVEHDARGDIAMFEPLDDLVDFLKRLKLDIGLDLAACCAVPAG